MTQALDNVSLQMNAGEIHALVGENGAGKSTLIKILTGIQQADQGELKFAGDPIKIRNSQEAQAYGIAPGFFAIEMNTALVDNPEFSAFIVSRNPLQRWGQPNEIGGAAVFLMSAAAK